MHPKRIIPIVLLLVIVGGVLWHFLGRDDGLPKDAIPGNGVIEATEVDISSKVAGKILSLTVHEGDAVRRGQRIAVLDSGELGGQVENAQGNLDAAIAALNELLAGTRAEDLRRLRAQVDAARDGLNQAKERLALLKAGTRKEQLAQLKAALVQAQAQLALVKAGPRKEDIAELRAAQAQAQAQLALVKEGPRKEQIAQLKAALSAAQAQLALVKEGPRKEQIAQLEANLAQAKVALKDAETELNRAKALYASGAIAGQAVDQATTRRDAAADAVDAARQRLSEAQNGARPQEIQTSEQQVEAAKQRLNEAQNGARPQEIQAAEDLVEIARQRMQAAENGARPEEIKQAEQLVEAAKQRLTEAVNGARPEDIGQAEALVAQAQAQVEAAQAALDLAIAGPRTQTIAAAKARVNQARGALVTAQASRGQTEITAPSDGRVTLRNAEPGELVTPGMPIVRIANLRTVWIRVYIPEPQKGLVKLGQRTDIVTDSYPGKRFAGKVIEIAEEPEFTPKNVQTQAERVKLVYGIKVEVDNPDQELKPGMPGDATIYLK